MKRIISGKPVKVLVTVIGLILGVTLTAFAVNGVINSDPAKESVLDAVYQEQESITPTAALQETPVEDIQTAVPTPTPLPEFGSLEDAMTVSEVREKLGFGKDPYIEEHAASLAQDRKVPVEKVMALWNQYEDWEMVQEELWKYKYNQSKLSEERVVDLYEQGYGIQDIEKAEVLSAQCGKSPEEILKIKGTTTEFNKKMAEKQKNQGNRVAGYDANDGMMTWDEVADELGIGPRNAVLKMGVSLEDYQQMKQEGRSDQEILDIALMADQYKKDYKTLWNALKNGQSLKDQEKKFREEKNETRSSLSAELDEKSEELMIRDFKMTEKEVQKCHEYGVTGGQVGLAKNLANKYDLPIEEVLKIRKTKSDWKEVEDVLGGGVNE